MTVHPEDQDGPTGGAGALGGLGGADLSSLMAQAQQMQQQLMAAQEELAQAEVVGLQIDPSAIDPTDAEGLADLVLAAIRDGSRAAQDLQSQAMGPLAQGLGGGGLGLPGL